jgi:hypothetical protein
VSFVPGICHVESINVTDHHIKYVYMHATFYTPCLSVAFDVSGLGLSGSAIFTHFGVTGPFDH